MAMSVKKFMKKFVPVSNAKMDDYYNELKKENEELRGLILNLQEALKGNRRELHDTHIDTQKIRTELHSVYGDIQKVRTELHSVYTDGQKIRTELHNEHEKVNEVKDGVYFLKKQSDAIKDNAVRAKKASDEAVWGLIFKDSIENSDWLLNKEFYPGRWAVGYQYLYVLYRVLNGVKPKSILELGLGQSTRMITQYVGSNPEIQHRVIEHDPEWIHFFKMENTLYPGSDIVQLDLIEDCFEDDKSVLMYKGFKDSLSDREYDFISVDAPFGGGANKYARVDTITLIPNHLAKSFVIMVDDANRDGEKNTIDLMKQKLEENGIEYCCGQYMGNKTTYVITSPDKKFICSL